MNKLGNQQTRAGQDGQGRGRGMCRNNVDDSSFATGSRRRNAGEFCRRFTDRSLQKNGSQQAEAVVGDEKRGNTSNLQMLKEQAGRLTQALKNIEAQIKSFESGN